MQTGPTDRLREWERTMRRGTDAARCGQAVLAERLYLEALALSRFLIDHVPAGGARADDCVAAFVVTHLNLADLHADAERTAEAATYLCAAHRALMALLRDPMAAPSLQQAACRHSRETHAALLGHLSDHGDQAEVLAALRAGCLPFPLRPLPNHPLHRSPTLH